MDDEEVVDEVLVSGAVDATLRTDRLAGVRLQMLQQMQNPSVQQLMGNPEALQVCPTNTEENCFDQIVSGHGWKVPDRERSARIELVSKT